MNSSRPALHPAAVDAVGWGWRHAGRRAWAVSELDLHIEAGERVLLLGASGAGKSTVVAALAGVLGADADGLSDEGEQSGSLFIDGQAPGAARGRVGLVLQDPDSQVILARVGDDVAFGCENLGVPRDEIWPRVRRALDDVGLDVPLDRPTSQLSGGQKQRLALAGVLAMQPGLVLLDEPTANLDPEGVAEVRDAVARSIARTGSTLIVIEHRVEVWRSLVDRVIVLSPGGGVLADGKPDQVLSTNGRALAESGVWIPEYPPTVPAPAIPLAGGETASGRRHNSAQERVLRPREVVLTGSDLSIGHRSAVQVGIDVQLKAGELLAITGPNGVGKSTLGLTLGGLLKPLAGEVVASPSLAAGAGAHPIAWKSRQLASRIGNVFQDPEHQFLGATVREELVIGPKALGLAGVDERVDELLGRLGLEPLARANPFTLSGGEKRRLSVAAVLATEPGVLILDEPTFGQDSRTWQELVALIAELLDGGTSIAAITHDTHFVEALATRRYELQASAVDAAGVVR